MRFSGTYIACRGIIWEYIRYGPLGSPRFFATPTVESPSYFMATYELKNYFSLKFLLFFVFFVPNDAMLNFFFQFLYFLLYTKNDAKNEFYDLQFGYYVADKKPTDWWMGEYLTYTVGRLLSVMRRTSRQGTEHLPSYLLVFFFQRNVYTYIQQWMRLQTNRVPNIFLKGLLNGHFYSPQSKFQISDIFFFKHKHISVH
jgi:hypothetical protein